MNLNIKNVTGHPLFTTLGSAIAIAVPIISDHINITTLGISAVVFVFGCLAGIKKS